MNGHQPSLDASERQPELSIEMRTQEPPTQHKIVSRSRSLALAFLTRKSSRSWMCELRAAARKLVASAIRAFGRAESDTAE